MWTISSGPSTRTHGTSMKDAVDRLTPLGVMVLALLGEGDMHPYEMIRLMRQRRDDRLVPITNGTLYHTVGRAGAGRPARRGRHRPRRQPPERTTYTLTDAGRRSGRRMGAPRAAAHRPARASSASPSPRRTISSASEVVALLRSAARRSRQPTSSSPPAARRPSRASARASTCSSSNASAPCSPPTSSWLDTLIARLERQEFPWGAPTRPDRTLSRNTERPHG